MVFHTASVLRFVIASSVDDIAYPLQAERTARSCGDVVVELDDEGNVLPAEATSGVELYPE